MHTSVFMRIEILFFPFSLFSRAQSKLVEMKGCVTKHKQLTEINLVKLIVTSEKITIKQGDLS